MDDPWGSPWATTDTTAAPSTSPSKNILEPPPPAFLSTPNTLTIPSSQSAWLEDDAYAGWASPDPGQPTNNPSPWTWGNDAAPIEGLTPSYEPRRKSSTPRWPRSSSPSPGLGPPISPNTAFPGQPSPDPWANHMSPYTRDDPEPLSQLPQIPDAPSPELESTQVGLGLTSSTYQSGQAFVTHEPDATQFADPMPSSAHEHLYSSNAPVSDPFPATVKHGGEAAPSSASAPSEDGGNNDEGPNTVHADSPMTSIEDNAASKVSQRKASGKVLELVEMYDGIAKRRATTPERIIPRRSASREPEAAACDVRDQCSKADKQSMTEKEALPRGQTDVDPRSLPDETDEATGHIDEVASSIRPDHDPFDIDLGKLNSLLPGTSEEVARASQDVSDRIVHDSFTSIPERKMWYRLSRNESLRKHNAGDDDNYVRINWTNSTLRQETLKTVRRWMEEDSFGGRAFRGGSAGNTGSKNFGWDATTAASPVDLDRVFGRRQKRQPAVHRPSSTGGLPPLSTVAMGSGPTGNTPISAQENGRWEGLEAFGWSSGAVDAKAATEAKPSKPSGTGIPLPLAFTGFDNKPKSHASLPAFIKPIAPTPPTLKPTGTAAEDSEDEWGDMVSPSTAAADSASLPKTSWDSFSTSPLPELASMAPSDSFTNGNLESDVLRTGYYDDGNSRNESGRGDIGSVISPTPAPTLAGVAADIPQSQNGSSDRSRSASTVKRPANMSVANKLSDPQTALISGKPGFSTGGLVETSLATGIHTSSTTIKAQNSTEGLDIVYQFVRNLPDLSYMLR